MGQNEKGNRLPGSPGCGPGLWLPRVPPWPLTPSIYLLVPSDFPIVNPLCWTLQLPSLALHYPQKQRHWGKECYVCIYTLVSRCPEGSILAMVMQRTKAGAVRSCPFGLSFLSLPPAMNSSELPKIPGAVSYSRDVYRIEGQPSSGVTSALKQLHRGASVSSCIK